MGLISSTTMRRIRRWHLYLGVAVTPMLLMFGVSGAWQAFRLHKRNKLGTYTPPWLLELISTAHTASESSAGLLHPSWAYRWLVCLVAAVLVVSALLGLIMAWRVSGGRTVLLLLAMGLAVPVLLLLLPL